MIYRITTTIVPQLGFVLFCRFPFCFAYAIPASMCTVPVLQIPFLLLIADYQTYLLQKVCAVSSLTTGFRFLVLT